MDHMVSIYEYLDGIKNIEENILQYLDEDDSEEINFHNLMDSFNKFNIEENKHELNLILHLISKISIYHHRSNGFFNKVERILLKLQSKITFFFSSLEIMTIFRKNKRILLFLLEEKIIIFDDHLFNMIMNPKYKEKFYDEYFLPDIEILNDDELNEFRINQKIGENERYICDLIRKDSIEDFISFLTRTNLSLSTQITQSIFETNPFLLKNKSFLSVFKSTQTLIEYAAFYGSFQIFQYLYFNNVELTPSLWHYAIHGNNADIIHLLEENGVKPEDNSLYLSLSYKNSIKCHHNQFADYIMNFMDTNEINYSFNMIKSYNFILLSNAISKFLDNLDNNNDKNNTIFTNLIHNLLKYGYYNLIDLLLKDTEVNEYKQIALIYAVENNNIDFTRTLLSHHNIDVNIYSVHNHLNESLLNIAVKNDNFEITELLLSYPNIDVNFIPNRLFGSEKFIDGEPALHTAIKKGNLKIVKLLLSNKNIDVNIKSEFCYFKGQTALHLAVARSDIEICRLLLSRPEIKVNSFMKKDYDNGKYDMINEAKKPIHIAAQKGNLEIMKLLLSHQDIDINSYYILNLSCIKMTKCSKKTALHIAIEKNNSDMVNLLLSSSKIDVNLFLFDELHKNEFFIEYEQNL